MRARAHRSTSSFPSAARRCSGRQCAAAEADFEALVGSTVLVVEDEPALAAAVSEALTDAGFVVDRAGDGEEALRRVGAKAYDLIVCDLKMPKIDGIRFYQKLSASHPDVARRVIFVTGDVAGTEAESFSRKAAAAGWPSRLGSGICSAPRAKSLP